MKREKLVLSLNKETVSTLNNNEMNNAKGGATLACLPNSVLCQTRVCIPVYSRQNNCLIPSHNSSCLPEVGPGNGISEHISNTFGGGYNNGGISG